MKDKYANPIKLFDAAQIACFNPAERKAYENSLKYYRDLKNVTDTAWEEGKEEGIKEGREEVIKEGREEGKKEGVELGSALRGWQVAVELLKIGTMSHEDIARVSGLSLDDVKQLLDE